MNKYGWPYNKGMKMKLTAIRPGKFYKRETDNAFFKKEENGEFKKINKHGKWIKTEDLQLSDNFLQTHENPGVDTYEDLFYKYTNGDAETQKKSLDLLLLGLARLADNIEGNDEV